MTLRKIQHAWAKAFAPSYATPEQVMAILTNWPQLLFGNLAVIGVAVGIFWSTPAKFPSELWAIFAFFTGLPGFYAMWRMSRKPRHEINVRSVAWNLIGFSAIRGMIWAVGFAMLVPIAQQNSSAMTQVLMFGMVVGGIISYWAMPASAMTFSGVALLGALVGAWNARQFQGLVPFSIGAIVTYLYFIRVVVAHAANLRAKFETMQNLSSEKEVVSMLLREFEAGAKDWLWRTNAAGRLVSGMSGFSAALGQSPAQFDAMPLAESLSQHAHTQDQKASVLALTQQLAGSDPFTGTEVLFGQGDEQLWLSFTAKPVQDAYGQQDGWQGVCANVTEARKAEAHIRRMALVDALTGLPNRAAFREILKATLEEKADGPRYIAFGDLDGFKNVNDTLGHAAGDMVLATLAKRFSSVLRPGETVARVGGDEFVFIFHRGHEGLIMVCQSLLGLAAEPIVVEGQPQYVGLSLGQVDLNGGADEADEILRKADLALYNAKQHGRGTARFYSPQMDEAVAERRELEKALRSAVAQRQFELYYQPIYECGSKSLRAYEALIRWKHPTRGMVPPATFIPLAEEFGLIGEIGAFVLNRACEDAKHFGHGIGVSVNISAVQMRSRRLQFDVAKALMEAGLAPQLLELEMTESALIESSSAAETLIKDLKALGVKLALDDFGTGYSSLAYLQRFSFDRIKIDRSFVQAYSEKSTSRAIVDAIIMLAHKLGISVTAEGIETETQFENMTEKGVELAQGFLLGRPMPVAAIDQDASKESA